MNPQDQLAEVKELEKEFNKLKHLHKTFYPEYDYSHNIEFYKQKAKEILEKTEKEMIPFTKNNSKTGNLGTDLDLYLEIKQECEGILNEEGG